MLFSPFAVAKAGIVEVHLTKGNLLSSFAQSIPALYECNSNFRDLPL
jgi:hypothetical protein